MPCSRFLLTIREISRYCSLRNGSEKVKIRYGHLNCNPIVLFHEPHHASAESRTLSTTLAEGLDDHEFAVGVASRGVDGGTVASHSLADYITTSAVRARNVTWLST